MKTYSVYKHTSPSGKIYIGITCGKPEKRWAKGEGYVNNPYFYRAIKHYGWNSFRHEIIAAKLSKQEAEEMERQLISQLHSDERPYGYNIDHGGSAIGRASEETKKKMSQSRMGHQTSEETKRKISKSHKGVPANPAQLAAIRARAELQRGKPLPPETRAKISETLSGRIRSPEHCKNISKAKLGHTVSDETRVKISKTKRTAASTRRGADNPKARAVVCVETGIVYPTVAAAKLATGVQNISRCCAGRRKTCGGYHWKYYEEEDHVDS